MAVLPVLAYPDPRLLVKTRPLTGEEPDLATWIQNMFETMYADKGLGLAATQVGWDRQMVVMDIPPESAGNAALGVHMHTDGPLCLMNPQIIGRSEEQDWMAEGCLSFPGLQIKVLRHRTVTLQYRDQDFRLQEVVAGGLFAQCIQHELEHLNGEVFINRLSALKRAMALKRYEKSDRRTGT